MGHCRCRRFLAQVSEYLPDHRRIFNAGDYFDCAAAFVNSFNVDAEHGGQRDIGMIAEEVGEVLPEFVGYEESGTDTMGMNYFIPPARTLQEERCRSAPITADY